MTNLRGIRKRTLSLIFKSTHQGAIEKAKRLPNFRSNCFIWASLLFCAQPIWAQGLIVKTLPTKGAMHGVQASLTTDEISPEQAWQVITDYAHFKEFMPLTAASDVLKTQGQTQWVSTTLKISLMKFQYVLKIAHQIKDNIYKNSWEKESGDLQSIEGSWEIAFSGKSTSMIYTSYVDAGQSVPGWIHDILIKRSIPDLFDAVLSRAKQNQKLTSKEPKKSPSP